MQPKDDDTSMLYQEVNAIDISTVCHRLTMPHLLRTARKNSVDEGGRGPRLSSMPIRQANIFILGCWLLAIQIQ